MAIASFGTQAVKEYKKKQEQTNTRKRTDNIDINRTKTEKAPVKTVLQKVNPEIKTGVIPVQADHKKVLENKIKKAEEKVQSVASGIRRASSSDIENINKLKSDVSVLKDEYERKYNSAEYFDRKAHQPGRSEARQADKVVAQYLPYLDTLNKNAKYYQQNQNAKFKLQDGTIKTGAELYSETMAEYDKVNSAVVDMQKTRDYYKNLTPNQQQALLTQKQNTQRAKKVKENEIAETEKVKNITAKYGFDFNSFSYGDFYDWAMKHGYTETNEGRIVPKFGKNAPTQQEKKEFDLLNWYAVNKRYNELSQGTKWQKAFASFESIGANIVGGLGQMPQLLKSSVTGQDIDLTSNAARHSLLGANIRENVTKDMSGKGAFLYQTGMSIADNLALLPMATIPGVGEGLVLGTMGSIAAAQKANQLTLQGHSGVVAAQMGLIAGAIEVVTEKIGLDNLMDLATKKAGKSVLIGMLKQVGAEGMEEGLSDILNFAFDQIAYGDNSEYNQKVRAYENGDMTGKKMSREEARKLAFADFATDLGMSVAGGALSGFVFGLGGGAINTGMTAYKGNQIINDGGAIGTINEGLGFNTDTDAYRNAEKLTKEMAKGKSGKNISSFAIGQQAVLNSEQSTKNANTLSDFAKSYGGNGKNIFTRFYIDGQDLAEYAREMNNAYAAGKTGEAMPIYNTISQDQAIAMYQAGQVDTQNTVGVIQNNTSERFRHDNPKTYNTLNGLGKRLNTKIVIDENIEGADGYFNPTSGELHINRNAQNPVNVLIKHEITHIAEGTNQYNELVSFMKDTFAEEWTQKETDIMDLYERINRSRALKGQETITLTEEGLSNEVMAEFAERFDSDAFLERIAQENPSMLTKIRDFIRDIIDRLKNVFSDSELKRWQKAERMWENAIKNADATQRTGDVEHKIKYDYTKSFSEQIDDYKLGRIPKNDTLLVSGTPKVWRDVGFNAVPVTINQTHVDYAINNTLDADHYIGETALKNLPEAIKDPVAIIQSKTHPDRAVGILVLDNNGKKIIVPIEVDGHGRINNKILDSNAITSVFGKGNILTQLADAITNTVNGQKELFYWDKKEALSLLQKARLQLPRVLPQDGFIHSIRENGSKVKHKFENVTETQQFKRWFGKSRVVNDDGTPKVVYHGSYSKFTIFDKGNKTSKAPESAYFFTDDEDVAYSYTGYKDVVDFENTPEYQGGIYPVYLAMKNPYIVDFKGYTWDSKAPVGKDINEVAQYAMDNGYDGVIAKNIIDAGDMGDRNWNEQKPIKTSTDYIVFSSTQIKSATDNIGTFDSENPDIRYKLQEPVDVQAENTELKRQLEDVKKRLAETQARAERAEARMRPQVLEKDIQSLAGKLIKEYDSDIKKADIADDLRDLGNYILRMGDGSNVYSFDNLKYRANKIADMIIEYAKEETPFAETYKQIKSYFKDTKITVTQKGDFADYESFRKSMFGKMRLVNEGGTAIDTLWAELGEMYGENLFPPEITAESDMIQHIADFLTDMDDVYYNPYDQNRGEMREIIANGIISELTDNVRTVALGDALDLNEKLIAEKKRTAEIMKIKTEIKNTQAALAAEWERLYEEKAKQLKEQQKFKDKKQAQEERAERQRLLKVAKTLTSKRFYDSATEATREEIDKLVGDINTSAIGILDSTLERRAEWLEKYRQLAKDNDFIPNPQIENMLKGWGVEVTHGAGEMFAVTKANVADLSIDEVREITDALISIEHEVQTANRLIGTIENLEIRKVGLDIISDIMATTGRKRIKKDNIFTDLYSAESLLKGENMVNRIVGYNSNSKLVALWQAAQNGQTEMLDYQMRANRQFRKWTEKKKFIESIKGKSSRTITITGTQDGKTTSVKITPAMLMSLYMHSQNYQNLRHIAKGGLHIPNYELLMKGDIKNALDKYTVLHMTPSEIKAATVALTAEERAFCDAMSKFYEGSAKEINKVSNILTGHDIAVVLKYFPIATDSRFLSSDSFVVMADGNIENMGFLQERIDSSTPIWLFGADEVLTRSIEQQSKYVGLAIPLRNINKVFGVVNITAQKIEGVTKSDKKLTDFEKKVAEGNRQINFNESLETAISKKWGSDTWEYMIRLLQDISGVQRNMSNLDRRFGKIKSAAASSALVGNIGVIIKQAASYPTAAAELGYKALIKGLTGRVNTDLLNKSSLYWYRQQGWNYAELAEYKQNGGHIQKWLNGIQGMDLLTVRRLLVATEAYIRDNNPNLRGEEYEKAVLDKFHDVIRRTQPNYTIMERPGIMRDKSVIAQVGSLYRTQPFQNLNILYDATGNYKAQKNRLGNLKSDSIEYKQAEQDYKTAGKRLVTAVTSQALSSFVFSLMQLAVDALKHKTKKYRNDDDEMTIISLLKGLGINMLGNGFGIIPFGSALWEGAATGIDALIKTAGGKEFFKVRSYGITNPMFEMFNDLGTETLTVAIEIEKAVINASNGEEVNWESLLRKSYKAATVVFAFKGIPLNNIKNDIDMVAKNVLYAVNGKDERRYWDLRLEYEPKDNKKEFYDLLYKAQGTKVYDAIKERLIENDGFNEKDIEDAMTDRYLERETNYKSNADKILKAGKKTEYYANLSKEEQEDFEKKVTQYAKGVALKNRKEPDKWITVAEKLNKASNIPVEKFIEIYAECSAIESDKDSKGETIYLSKSIKRKEYIDSQVSSSVARNALYDLLQVGKSVQEGTQGGGAKISFSQAVQKVKR